MGEEPLLVRVKAVGGVPVGSAGDYWRIHDKWWKPDEMVEREFVELHLVDGSRVVVFREDGGAWVRAPVGSPG